MLQPIFFSKFITYSCYQEKIQNGHHWDAVTLFPGELLSLHFDEKLQMSSMFQVPANSASSWAARSTRKSRKEFHTTAQMKLKQTHMCAAITIHQWHRFPSRKSWILPDQYLPSWRTRHTCMNVVLTPRKLVRNWWLKNFDVLHAY